MFSINSLTIYILLLLSHASVMLILLGCFAGLISLGLLMIYIIHMSSINSLTKITDTLSSLDISAATKTYNDITESEINDKSKFKDTYESTTKLLNDVDIHIKTLIQKLDNIFYKLRISVILTLIFMLLWIFIPDKETYMKMVLAENYESEITNVKIIMDHIDMTTDKILKTITQPRYQKERMNQNVQQ